MDTYERFKKSNINLSIMGLERRDTYSTYFCTPKGAEIIGCAGVDGIHYCFIHEHGEMVFVVSPMNMPGDYVHPVAKNFADFLRLILACVDLAAVEQAHGWDEEHFYAFIKDNPPTLEQADVIHKIKIQMALEPMDNPYVYIKEIQSTFYYDSISYNEEYYEFLPQERKAPEWKVYYQGFFGCTGQNQEGKEIPIKKQFEWESETWHIPSFYVCSEGLVVDFCIEVDTAALKAFIDKWKTIRDREDCLSHEEIRQIESENPLVTDFSAQLTLNNKILRNEHGIGTSWIPLSCIPEGTENQPEANWVIEHYGLDRTKGWIIQRLSFPWATNHKPNIRSLSLHLEQRPAPILGMCFETPPVGESLTFTHPITGRLHTLTVQDFEKQELDDEHFHDVNMKYPTYFTAMTYTLNPDLSRQCFMIQDCAQSDQPQRKKQEASTATAIGIIGGADGPTAIFATGENVARPHVVFSSLHFEPIEQVKWQMIFLEKLRQDIEVDLIK